MTEQPPEENDADLQPLFGAVGPYLSFTTGHMNPIEPDDDDEDDEEYYDPEADTDFWEDDEE